MKFISGYMLALHRGKTRTKRHKNGRNKKKKKLSHILDFMFFFLLYRPYGHPPWNRSKKKVMK